MVKEDQKPFRNRVSAAHGPELSSPRLSSRMNFLNEFGIFDPNTKKETAAALVFNCGGFSLE
jgi:hypothetical protein